MILQYYEEHLRLLYKRNSDSWTFPEESNVFFRYISEWLINMWEVFIHERENISIIKINRNRRLVRLSCCSTIQLLLGSFLQLLQYSPQYRHHIIHVLRCRQLRVFCTRIFLLWTWNWLTLQYLCHHTALYSWHLRLYRRTVSSNVREKESDGTYSWRNGWFHLVYSHLCLYSI